MKIIDFVVASYFAILKNYGEKGFYATVSLVVILPFTVNILSLIFYLSQFVRSSVGHIITPFVVVVLGLFISFSIKSIFGKLYSKKYGYIKTFSEKFPRIFLVFVAIIHYLLSIIFFVYCMKFIL